MSEIEKDGFVTVNIDAKELNREIQAALQASQRFTHAKLCLNDKIESWCDPEIIDDAVNSPSHYASGEIECIDAIKASMTPDAFTGYLKGNVQKYMWRYEKKVNPAEDLKKAQWYLARLIEEVGQ